jgi:hypothetical protein
MITALCYLATGILEESNNIIIPRYLPPTSAIWGTDLWFEQGKRQFNKNPHSHRHILSRWSKNHGN